MIDITKLYLHVINRTYIYVLYYIYVRILLGFDARLRTILKSNQRAKRWLYLSNPSSINQYESNAKKKKRKRTIVVIQIHIKFYF